MMDLQKGQLQWFLDWFCALTYFCLTYTGFIMINYMLYACLKYITLS